MQTPLFIKKVRQLNEDIQVLIAEDRAGTVSPDALKEVQKDLVRLMQERHNPALSCLIDLRESADRLGLDTDIFESDFRDCETAWEEQYS